MYTTLSLAVTDRIARVTIERPEKLEKIERPERRGK